MLEGNVSTTNVRTHVKRDVRTYVKRDVRKLEEPFLVPPPPHYVSSIFLLCFYGSFFLDATDFHSRIPYVVVNDQTPGSIIIYFLSHYYLYSLGFGGFGSTTLRTSYFQGSIGSFCFQFRNSQLTL